MPKLFEELIERHDFYVFGIASKQLKGFLPVVAIRSPADDKAAVYGVGLDVIEPGIVLDLGNLPLKLVLLVQRLIDRSRQIGRRCENAIAKWRLVEDRGLRCLDLEDRRVVGQAVLDQKIGNLLPIARQLPPAN